MKTVTNNTYYADQLKKIEETANNYPYQIKVTNGNADMTNWMQLNDESAAVLIQWLKNNFPNCED